VNHKKIQRLWREEGLRVPQRRHRKRLGISTAPDMPKADAPNNVWAVDFQFDVTTDGRPIKIVSIVDEHTREHLGGLVDRSVTGEDLIDELDRIAGMRGYPAVLCCDNGPEPACQAMPDWAGERVGLSFIPPVGRGATATSVSIRLPAPKGLTLAMSDRGVFDSICRSLGAGDHVEPAEQP
jgi:putative transposase